MAEVRYSAVAPFRGGGHGTAAFKPQATPQEAVEAIPETWKTRPLYVLKHNVTGKQGKLQVLEVLPIPGQ
jgi:hypothetical protein